MNTKPNASGQPADVIAKAAWKRMGDEIDQQSVGIARIRDRKALYLPLQLPAHRAADIRAKNDLLGLLKSKGMTFQYASDDNLKDLYEQMVYRLNKKWQLPIKRTLSEYIAYCQLRGKTRLQILRSVWIGNVNLDFFIPAVRSSLGQGLVIEVDGSIHDRELKGRKDSSKLEFLHGLGIAVMVVENDDLSKPKYTIQRAFDEMKVQPRGCSRARKLLWRKIYLATILCHASDEELAALFGYIPIP